MNILFLETNHDIVGGGQKSLQLLLRSLKPGDFKPILWTGGNGTLAAATQSWCHAHYGDGPAPGTTGLPRRIRELVSPRFFLRFRRELIEIIARHAVTIIHCNDLLTALAAGLVRPNSVKIIYHCRVPHSVGPVNRFIDRIVAGRIDRLVAVSQATALRFQGLLPPDKISIIPNGIDLSDYKLRDKDYALHNQLHIPREAVIVGSTSRIIPGKRQHLLIETFAALAPEFPRLHLVIAGNPDEDRHYTRCLEELIRNYALGSRVFFTGMLTDIPKFLRSIDILSVVTYGEAMARTVLEGMAAAKAMIVSDDGGNPEMISHEQNGLIVKLDDRPAFVRELRRLVSDAGLRQKLSAAALVSAQRYSVERSTEMIESVYRGLR